MEITGTGGVEGGRVHRPPPVAPIAGRDEPALTEPGLRPAMVAGLASELAAERRRGELQPWQELSGQYLLVLAQRFAAGAPTPLPDRLLEAGLRYVADGGSAAP